MLITVCIFIFQSSMGYVQHMLTLSLELETGKTVDICFSVRPRPLVPEKYRRSVLLVETSRG